MTQLLHGLGQIAPSDHVGLGELPTVGIGGKFPTDRDMAFFDELKPFAGSDEAEPLDLVDEVNGRGS